MLVIILIIKYTSFFLYIKKRPKHINVIINDIIKLKLNNG